MARWQGNEDWKEWKAATVWMGRGCCPSAVRWSD